MHLITQAKEKERERETKGSVIHYNIVEFIFSYLRTHAVIIQYEVTDYQFKIIMTIKKLNN